MALFCHSTRSCLTDLFSREKNVFGWSRQAEEDDLLENANSNAASYKLERQVDVLSRLLNKQAVKPAQLLLVR